MAGAQKSTEILQVWCDLSQRATTPTVTLTVTPKVLGAIVGVMNLARMMWQQPQNAPWDGWMNPKYGQMGDFLQDAGITRGVIGDPGEPEDG